MLAFGGLGQCVNEIRNHGVRISPSTGPPAGKIIDRGQLVIEPLLDDSMFGIRLRSTVLAGVTNEI